MGGTLSKEYDEVTSNVPFFAMLVSGQQRVSNDVNGGGIASELKDFWINEIKHSNAILAISISALWVLTKGRGGTVAAAGRMGKINIPSQ